MVHFFTIVLYQPIYNLLISLVNILPGGDIGLAVIIVTIIVKLVIMPLTVSSLRTSRAMQQLQPKFKEIQEQYKDDKELQAKETFALYKKYKINPFASIFAMLIQLPVILALYYVFRHEAAAFDPSVLYSFVHAPAVISTKFLGFFNLTSHNIVLAALAAITQYLQARYAMPVPAASANASASEQFNRSMSLQMRYMLPVLIGVIAYFYSGAIALYFITSALFALAQELLILRRLPATVTD